jgi:drug/metabolite transporter (DMT)-like permease
MVGAAVAFSVLNALAKYLSQDYPTLQIVWARTLGHLLFVVAAFTPMHGRRLFATRHPAFQLTRSLLLLVSTAFYFTALRFIGLATAATISFTTPCIVALLAAPLLDEQVDRRRWIAIGVGFAGALIVIRPGVDVAQLASLLVLGTAASSALYQVLTRRVAGGDPPETTVAYSGVVGAVVMSAIVPVVWTAPPSVTSLGLLASLGLWGGLGHYFVARAFLWGPASAVAPLSYVQLVGAAVSGYLVFGDVPDVWVWVGAVLIVGSGLLILSGERGAAGALVDTLARWLRRSRPA